MANAKECDNCNTLYRNTENKSYTTATTDKLNINVISMKAKSGNTILDLCPACRYKCALALVEYFKQQVSNVTD